MFIPIFQWETKSRIRVEPSTNGWNETFSRGLLDLRDEFILTAVAASEAGFTTEGKLKGGRLLTTSEYNLALYRDLRNLKFED